MANANYGIIKLMLEDGGIDFFPQTKGFLVEMNDGKDLEVALAEILSAVASKATTDDIATEIAKIVGGASEAYDTLKEIEDWITNYGDEASNIILQLAGKVDKEEGKGLSTEDFTTALKIKLEGLENYVHPSTHSAEIITETTDKQFITDVQKEKLEIINGVASGTTPAEETDFPSGTVYFEITGEIAD